MCNVTLAPKDQGTDCANLVSMLRADSDAELRLEGDPDFGRSICLWRVLCPDVAAQHGFCC